MALETGKCGTLLLVLPGNSGREAVLRRLVTEVCPVAVLVPAKFAPYSSWARPLASAWLEFGRPDDGGFSAWAEAAWAAVSAWIASEGRGPLGCTTWDEWGIELCAYLCDATRLGLPYTPLATVQQVRNKVHFRHACAKAGVPAPRCVGLQNEAELRATLQELPWQYPLIIKPAKGAGSYYCRRVQSEEELLAAFPELDENLRSEGKTPKEDAAAGWSLEEFFSGAEVDVDGWAKDGRVEWMLISDNRPCLGASCCETGGMYPSQLPARLLQRLEDLTHSVVAAMPGLHSTFHFEALVNIETEAVMPVELNLRTGGAECPCCVEAVSGVFLPLAAADLALGRAPRPPQPAKVAVVASTNEHRSSPGVVKACEGTEELYADPDFIGAAFFAQKDAPYVPGKGSVSCLCWVAAGGSDADVAEQNLQRCISKCRLEVESQD